MTRRLTRIFSFISLFLQTSIVLSQWMQTNGPYGGRTTAFTTLGDSILAGTDGGGIFISIDVGQSWTPSNSGLTNKRITSLTVHQQFIFAGSEIGLFRSTNGDNWSLLQGLPDTIAYSVAARDTFVFVGTIGFGIFRTSDDGNNWMGVNSGLGNFNVYEIFIADSGIYAGTDGGVYYSTDQGETWEQRSSGIANPRIRSFAEVDSFLFVGTSGGGVYRSSNRGVTWEGKSSGLSSFSVFAMTVIGNNIFAGTGSGVFISTNNAGNWNSVSSGIEFPSVNAFLVVTPTLLAGTDGAVYRTGDNGANWVRSDYGLTSTRVRDIVTHGSTLFAATLGSGVYRSTDQGDTWEGKSTGLSNGRVFCITYSGSFLYAGTSGSGVFRSTNDGEGWNPLNDGLANLYINALFATGSSVYCGTRSGVFKLASNETTWTACGLTDSVVTSFAVSGATLFAGTQSARVLRSMNNGPPWIPLGTNKPFGLPDTAVYTLAIKGANLFAGATTGVFRSANNGDTWIRADSGLPDTTVNDFLVTGGSLYSAQFVEGVYLTTDDGNSWTGANEGLTNSEVASLAIVESTLFAGTNGGGVEKRALPPTLPSLLTPANGSVNGPPLHFSWLPSSGADFYHFQISLNSAFTVLVVNDSTITDTSTEVSNLAYNANYFWRVRALGTGGVSDYTPARSFSTPSELSFVNSIVHTFPTDPTSSTDYRLIGFPGSDTLVVKNIFQGTQGEDYRVFRDNGGVPPDHLDELGADSLLNTGEGYWVVAKGQLSFSQTVTMPKLDTLGFSSVKLDTGWNIITNPFDVPVSVASTALANHDTFATFWDYTGATGFTDATQVLKPFAGYYYENALALDSLRLAYPFPASPTPSTNNSIGEWNLQLILETDGKIDAHTLLGIARASKPGRDLFDKKKPPGFQDEPFLCFNRPEWDAQGGLFSRDFRPSLDTGQVWTFEIRNLQSSSGVIRVLGIDQLPSGCPAAISGFSDGGLVDLRKTNEYHYQATGDRMSFAIVIGPGDFVDQETVPKEFALFQNYPNPFNPTTHINYQMPHNSYVVLKLYDLLGREVVTLVDEFRKAGRYSAAWDGTSSSGNRISSGVYFYRLTADSFTNVKKLLVLK